MVGGYSHEELFFVKKKYLPMSFINKSCNCVKPFSDFGLVLQWLMTVNRTTLQFFPKLIDFVIVNLITSFSCCKKFFFDSDIQFLKSNLKLTSFEVNFKHGMLIGMSN